MYNQFPVRIFPQRILSRTRDEEESKSREARTGDLLFVFYATAKPALILSLLNPIHADLHKTVLRIGFLCSTVRSTALTH